MCVHGTWLHICGVSAGIARYAASQPSLFIWNTLRDIGSHYKDNKYGTSSDIFCSFALLSYLSQGQVHMHKNCHSKLVQVKCSLGTASIEVTVYCKLFKVEKFCGCRIQIYFAGNICGWPRETFTPQTICNIQYKVLFLVKLTYSYTFFINSFRGTKV